METLAGKWALITGSSRGIGQQIAMGLAQVRCGIILHARKAENVEETLALLSEYDVPTSVVAGDLALDSGVTEVIQGVLDEPGYVDILYNNAAIMNAWQSLWDIPKSDWQEGFQVNLFAQVAICNAFIPGMIERGFGRVINLTSSIQDIPELAPYSVAKAALDKYTADLAAGLRDANVLVNTLDPGWLRTDMGGPEADHDVSSVLPGAIVPALLDDHGPSGQRFAAQDYGNTES